MNKSGAKKLTTRTGVILALAAVYLAWGSTYLAIRFALESLPPLLMMGIRFFLVGLGVYAFLRLRGASAPSAEQWRWSAVVGAFLMLGGSGGVAWAEQSVASGLAALVIATTPLWAVLFAAAWKHRPTMLEWAGLAIGFGGIMLLNIGGDLRASPLGAAVLVLAAMSWAFGSVWGQRLPLPKGMMAGAAQMIAGGAIVMAAGLGLGERITSLPTLRSVGAVVYLGVAGSLVGFTAFLYLLGRVRPALAMSYAYVNPVIAIMLGVWLAGERVGPLEIAAMAVILGGVALVVMGQRTRKGGDGESTRPAVVEE